MALIIDYDSLSQAIVDWTHRQDLQQGQYTDYFIQNAQLAIPKDIIRANFGNGIRAMETEMIPVGINGGTIPVPSDWYAPKDLQVVSSDGEFDLTFKAANWLYNNYPVRQPQGLPEYIARDQIADCAFTAVLFAGTLTVSAIASGVLAVGMIYTAPGVSAGATITGLISGTMGGIGAYSVTNANDIASGAMTGGGEVFIFGPYPDSAYTVQGTYYSTGLPLNDQNPTNWMVLTCPDLFHAACMVEAARFLKDAQMFQMWSPVYQDGIDKLINQDKGERFSSGTLAIELG